MFTNRRKSQKSIFDDYEGFVEKFKPKTLIIVDAAGQHAGHTARELLKSGFNAAKLSGDHGHPPK